MASSVYWTTITDPDGSKKSGFIQDGRTYYAEGGEIKSGASVTGANGKTYTKGGSSSSSSGSGIVQQATNKELSSGGKYSVDDDGTIWYSVGGQQYNMSAPSITSGSSSSSSSYIDELKAAQAAAEEAERQKIQNNIDLINQQMQSIRQQTTDQKSDIYTTSRLGAIQNAERQAALGLGGGVYSDAPSGYAESVRLRQDSDLQNSLNSADQAALDAQRTLENMKTNAVTTGESDINAVTSQYAQLIAQAKQEQAQREVEQAWMAYEAEQSKLENERKYTQQEWENSYKQSALDADIKANELSQALDRAQAEYSIYGKIVSPDLITLLGGNYTPSSNTTTNGGASRAASQNTQKTQTQSMPVVQSGITTGLNLLTNAAVSNAAQQSDTEQKRIDYLVSKGITNESQIRNILANWEGYSRNWGINF